MTASMDLILSADVRPLGAFHQKSPRQLLRISDDTTESHMMKYYNGPVWPISYPVDASRYLCMWLDLTTSHRQTWLFSSTSTHHSTDLLTARGVAHLVVHGTTGSASYETIPPVRLETSRDVLSTVDMVVQRRDVPCQLRDHDDDGDYDSAVRLSVVIVSLAFSQGTSFLVGSIALEY